MLLSRFLFPLLLCETKNGLLSVPFAFSLASYRYLKVLQWFRLKLMRKNDVGDIQYSQAFQILQIL